MKTNKKKEKSCKDEKLLSQRTKMILKNVDLGIQFSSKRDELAVKRDSIMRERKKTDSTLENTANCKRTLSKFFDSKVN